MIIINSRNIDQILWTLRDVQSSIEATPIVFARRQVGRYLIQLGSLGHLYGAVGELMERIVTASNMADKLGLKDYSIVVEPSGTYITPEDLPEVIPPFPKAKPAEPLKMPEVELNMLGCRDITPGYIKFCVGNVEIAYYYGGQG
ncbi:hypothetical protein TUZN_0658 [Thermoproteus uzoniensis 768-20]|uniref:Uncharacterized protein n=1 Tax=Thermoproteus uzoniensis (strain 768-20) TaxID=999630 RepID=F2L494_THEU7|nr:hypothetical protein TUZN_0658 [Thermoproteus uzoniensis 768-20]